MGPIDEVRRIVTPSLEAMGYELVRVQISGRERLQLQIMAERVDRQGMTVDDCAEISRAVSAALDVEDPIPGPYTLEVSSPGIDRPLTREGDWDRFSGHEAKVDLRTPLDGRKRFRGILRGLRERSVILTLEDGSEVALPVDEVQRAKLVLTDALIAATAASEAAARQRAAGKVAGEAAGDVSAEEGPAGGVSVPTTAS